MHSLEYVSQKMTPFIIFWLQMFFSSQLNFSKFVQAKWTLGLVKVRPFENVTFIVRHVSSNMSITMYNLPLISILSAFWSKSLVTRKIYFYLKVVNIMSTTKKTVCYRTILVALGLWRGSPNQTQVLWVNISEVSNSLKSPQN